MVLRRTKMEVSFIKDRTTHRKEMGKLRKAIFSLVLIFSAIVWLWEIDVSIHDLNFFLFRPSNSLEPIFTIPQIIQSLEQGSNCKSSFVVTWNTTKLLVAAVAQSRSLHWSFSGLTVAMNGGKRQFESSNQFFLNQPTVLSLGGISLYNVGQRTSSTGGRTHMDFALPRADRSRKTSANWVQLSSQMKFNPVHSSHKSPIDNCWQKNYDFDHVFSVQHQRARIHWTLTVWWKKENACGYLWASTEGMVEFHEVKKKTLHRYLHWVRAYSSQSTEKLPCTVLST